MCYFEVCYEKKYKFIEEYLILCFIYMFNKENYIVD